MISITNIYVEERDLILEALGKLPLERSMLLYIKIKAQTEAAFAEESKQRIAATDSSTGTTAP